MHQEVLVLSASPRERHKHSQEFINLMAQLQFGAAGGEQMFANQVGERRTAPTLLILVCPAAKAKLQGYGTGGDSPDIQSVE